MAQIRHIEEQDFHFGGEEVRQGSAGAGKGVHPSERDRGRKVAPMGYRQQ